MGRKLRGEQWADVLDLAEWALALGDPAIFDATAASLDDLVGDTGGDGRAWPLPS